ncbi:MAG: DAK2 domain-containing protein [Dehalococcoidales bacterium]|nr:DAK2 domain-containing protein [Dehalococcoidales bacterium]
MKQVESINGREFREMLSTATSWLEKSSSDIDALNVFPVPDGDTGTNMLLTMRSSVDEAYAANPSTVSDVAKAVAQGALMGARGNSGVILSQILRGISEGLKDKRLINSTDWAEALHQASTVAYKGISNPVEGTILTVIKDSYLAGFACIENGTTEMIAVMEAIVAGAGESVANTPTLLPVLREAGVVDAGGQGLYTILEGALRYLRGEAELMQFRKPQMIASNIPASGRMPQLSPVDEVPFGYCTEFMLKGENINTDKVRSRLKKEGESLIVVGDAETARIHIHTTDPGKVLRYAVTLGTMHQVSIRNMDEQYHDFLEMQKSRAVVDTATIAVVAGDGLAEVFSSLGATAIVPGGQTMNPSTKDILQAVKAVASDKVIILPNNKNIILTAEQVKTLTEKTIEIIPTQSIPQGVAALLAFDYEADFNTNAELMREAKSLVKTIEITRAVRAAQLDGLSIKKKQLIGLLDDELLAAGQNTLEILEKIFAKIDMNQNEIVTIYYGAETKPEEAQEVSESIRQKYTQLQVEVVKGGQPYYDYIVSIE